ncbi:MAG: hypothetical protein ACUVUQ_09650 [Thermodesulfovibrionales bacterium]
MTRAAAAAEADIQAWLSSSLKVGPQAALVECDTNWDGSVGSGDMTNAQLAAVGVDVQYVSARSQASGNEFSPWNAGTPLWARAAAMDPAPGSCANNGQITVGQTANQVSITACDNQGNVIYHKIVSAD